MAKTIKKKAAVKKKSAEKKEVIKPGSFPKDKGIQVLKDVGRFLLFRLFGEQKRYVKRQDQNVGYVFTRDKPAAVVFQDKDPQKVADNIGNVQVELLP